MSEMTGVERIGRQLNLQQVDRIGVAEEFWQETKTIWRQQGKISDANINHLLQMDMDTLWPFNYKIHPELEDRLVAEDEDTRTFIDGNGATLRRHKRHASTPEHIGYAISNREEWEEKGKPFITPSQERIDFENYRKSRDLCREDNRFFCWSGVNVFEQMHPICGHENLLMGIALDPGWIKEMSAIYAELNINLMETLFAEEGEPDGIWFYEDMGFKGRPFMSPEMYCELIMPYHKRTIDYAHGRGLKVIMHSCGYVEAGIDCLEAMEVKAGMDLLRIYRNFGDRIALMGGLDARPVASNDLEGIRKELEEKIPIVKSKYGFILHTDHSIPESTEFETYVYFKELGLRLGTY